MEEVDARVTDEDDVVRTPTDNDNDVDMNDEQDEAAAAAAAAAPVVNKDAQVPAAQPKKGGRRSK